jgi:hypothetical protein
MVMDRVEINGIWYVREELNTSTNIDFQFVELSENLFAHTENISYEDNEYRIELMVLVYAGKKVMPSLQISDKLNDLTETWDSETFLMELIELDSQAINIVINEPETITINNGLLNVIVNLLKYAKTINLL